MLIFVCIKFPTPGVSSLVFKVSIIGTCLVLGRHLCLQLKWQQVLASMFPYHLHILCQSWLKLLQLFINNLLVDLLSHECCFYCCFFHFIHQWLKANIFCHVLLAFALPGIFFHGKGLSFSHICLLDGFAATHEVLSQTCQISWVSQMLNYNAHANTI